MKLFSRRPRPVQPVQPGPAAIRDVVHQIWTRNPDGTYAVQDAGPGYLEDWKLDAVVRAWGPITEVPDAGRVARVVRHHHMVPGALPLQCACGVVLEHGWELSGHHFEELRRIGVDEYQQ
jgi:hypothetical protein